jgi:metallo-beta-lactamase family protein
MGEEATDILCRFPDWHQLEAQRCNAMFSDIITVKKLPDTYRVIKSKGKKIVIAASGMLTGGRVLHYLKELVGDSRNTILLAGYQAEGTRGRTLLSGAPDVKIFGSYYPIRAAVKELSTLSAHADQKELLDWVGAIEGKPEKVFVVHGEPDAAFTLSIKIKDTFGYEAKVPALNEEAELFTPVHSYS